MLDAEVSIRDLFADPTPAGLARTASAGARARPALRPVVPRPQVLPLSFAQSRMWFLNRLGGAEAAYNISLALRLAGDLDQDALAAALSDVAAGMRACAPCSLTPEAFRARWCWTGRPAVRR